MVAVAVVVELDRHVVRQVVRLEFPDRDVIRLDLGHLVEGGRHLAEVVHLLVVVGSRPKDVRGDTAHAERGQAHRFAGRIDIAQIRLREFVFVAQLRELAARQSVAFAVDAGRLAEQEQRVQKQADRDEIADLPGERRAEVHAAISRVLSKK